MERRFQYSNLQILRAFAAMNVVVYHAIAAQALYLGGAGPLAPLSAWGQNGVDLFFVLSGFIIYHTQWRAEVSVRAYALARVIRIGPIYWLFSLVMIAGLILVPGAFEQRSFSPGWAVSSLAFLSGTLQGAQPVIFVGWTLEYEMLFYLVFAGALILRRVSPLAGLAALYLTIAGLTALTGVGAIALEFLMGVTIAAALRRFRPAGWTQAAIAAAGAALLLASIPAGYPQPRWIVWGVPAALIVLGAAGARQIRAPALEFAGDASYSIYLAQAITVPLWFKLAQAGGLSAGPVLNVAGAALFTLAAGLAAYVLAERPVIGFLRARLHRRGPATHPQAV